MLPIWEPAVLLAGEAQRAWHTAARRITAGIGYLAHLDVTADPELGILAFQPGDDLSLATRWAQAIASENVEARVIVDGAGLPGVQLPCRPDFSDEEIRHVVLACVKAAHTPGLGLVPTEVTSQLDALFAAERVVSSVASRLRSLVGRG